MLSSGSVLGTIIHFWKLVHRETPSPPYHKRDIQLSYYAKPSPYREPLIRQLNSISPLLDYEIFRPFLRPFALPTIPSRIAVSRNATRIPRGAVGNSVTPSGSHAAACWEDQGTACCQSLGTYEVGALPCKTYVHILPRVGLHHSPISRSKSELR